MILGRIGTLGAVITLRPTKILARKLGITIPEAPPPVPSRIADWCAHTFRLGREPWLVFCNTASLYPVFARASGVHDDESLMRRAGGMVEQVLKTNCPTQHAAFAAELTEFQWAPIPDRSVLGSISDLIYLAKPSFDDPNLMPAVLSAKLGQTPMSALGMNRPARAFASLQT